MVAWTSKKSACHSLIRKGCYMFRAPLELKWWYVTDQSYGTLVTIAPYGSLSKFPRFYVSLRPYMCPCLCPCPYSCSCTSTVPANVLVRVIVSIHIRIRVNFHMEQWKLLHAHHSNNPGVEYEAVWNLKAPLTWKRWVKSAKNLVASFTKKDLSIDTTFSQMHFAGQSL